MRPFPKPMAAIYHPQPYSGGEPEGVAIIATDEDEFLAIDKDGKPIQADWGLFTITDPDVLEFAYQGEGS